MSRNVHEVEVRVNGRLKGRRRVVIDPENVASLQQVCEMFAADYRTDSDRVSIKMVKAGTGGVEYQGQ